MRSFTYELGKYIDAKSDFYFGSQDDLPAGKSRWLKVGELVRGMNGVFLLADPSPPPDPYNPWIIWSVSFWSVNQSSEAGWQDLHYLYEMFNQNSHFPLDSYMVITSLIDGQIEDQDRSSDNLKLQKLSAIFYGKYLVS